MENLKLTEEEKTTLIWRVTQTAKEDILDKRDAVCILEVCRTAADRKAKELLDELRREMVIEGGKKREE